MAAAVSALLQVEGLHKRFGGVQAVRDISLSVPPASVFAIIGPNGAGKSTMLNLLSGVHRRRCRAADVRGDRCHGAARRSGGRG